MFGLFRKGWARLSGSAIQPLMSAWTRSAFLASSQQQILLGCLLSTLIYQTTNKSSDDQASLAMWRAALQMQEHTSGDQTASCVQSRACDIVAGIGRLHPPTLRVQAQAYASAAAQLQQSVQTGFLLEKGAQTSKGLKTCTILHRKQPLLWSGHPRTLIIGIRCIRRSPKADLDQAMGLFQDRAPCQVVLNNYRYLMLPG
jgi:hypothetical protein